MRIAKELLRIVVPATLRVDRAASPRRADAPAPTSELLDRFIPAPIVRKRHEVTIAAPADLVFNAAIEYDLGTNRLVRFIIWLRAKLLRSKGRADFNPGTLLNQMLSFGWRILAKKSDSFVVLGAVCQPWQANVIFTGVAPDDFARYANPGMVKILWTVEAEPISADRTRFGTETRVTATDEEAAARFLTYWMFVGMGSMLIRKLLMAGVRREAERRWEHRRSRTMSASTR